MAGSPLSANWLDDGDERDRNQGGREKEGGGEKTSEATERKRKSFKDPGWVCAINLLPLHRFLREWPWEYRNVTADLWHSMSLDSAHTH